jgi:hypothetical protein
LVNIRQISPQLFYIALTTEFDAAESSSHNSPTQIDTVSREQTERKRKRLASGVLNQGELASETDTLSTLPRDVLDRGDRIASPEVLAQLLFWFWVRRGSPSNKELEGTLERLGNSKIHHACSTVSKYVSVVVD